MTQPKTARQKQMANSIFHELIRSLCFECKRVIDAEIHLRDGRVIMRKRCSDHGWFLAPVSPDVEGYLDLQRFNKPGTIPLDPALIARGKELIGGVRALIAEGNLSYCMLVAEKPS
jgi:uncharacterized radical SAM superfamily Fe-S cluster-containing enzyme